MLDRPDRLRYSLGSQFAVQALKLVLSVSISGWISRYLGPANLGKLSYAFALAGIFAPFGSLGVQGSLSALLCNEPQLPGLVPTAFVIEILGTAVVALVLLPFALLSKEPIISALIGTAVLCNLFNSAEVFETELLILQRGTLIARVGLLQILSNTLLSSTAIWRQAPLLVFGWLQVAQSMLRALLLACLAPSGNVIKSLANFDRASARELIARGLPLLVAGLSVSLYMKSDQVMLQWLKGAEAVGQYSVAVKVAETFYFLPVMLCSTYFPRIGKAAPGGSPEKELRQLYRYAWLLGTGMMLANILFLPLLIPIIFGPDFQEAKQSLALSGLASFAVATGCASSCWLQTKKLEWISTARTALGAAVNIALNLALIPHFGSSGAAVATSISYLIATFAMTMLINKETRENTLVLLNPF
ncbi:MAG: flippase [Cyanobacteriota bacterium]|jgi:O-antigen/teichoic acid export membrane protein